MTTPGEHPDHEQLARYAAGQLDDAAEAQIEQHLAACVACQQALAALPPDPLSERLRVAYQSGVREGFGAGIDPTQAPAELANHPRYQIEGFLGAGGMGVVYKAQHRLMQRTVALKIIRRHLLTRTAAVERFVAEVRAAAQLSHPNIVQAFDADQIGNLHFLVMEFVEGTNLARWVEDKGPLSVAQACDVIRQAALGLQHAHERGMTHRDVKPQNLMRTPSGGVKILDFGLARFASEIGPGDDNEPVLATGPPSGTATGIVLGSVDYLAPEQAEHSRTADPRADIYALGCSFYFLLTGRPPFPEGTVEDKLAAHRSRTPPSLAELRSDVPTALIQVIERMMAKEPGQRYVSAAAVAAALRPFLPARIGPRPLRIAVSAVLVLLLVIGGLALFNHSREQTPKQLSAEARTTILHPQTNALEWVVESKGRMVEKFHVIKFDTDDVSIKGDHRIFKGHQERVVGVGFSSDGRWLVSADRMGNVRRWDLTGHKHEAFAASPPTQTGCAAFAPEPGKSGGQLALLGGRDATCRLWEVSRGKLLGPLREGGDHKPGERERRAVNALAFSPDGRRALTESERGGLCVWEITTRQESGRLESPGYYAQAVAMTPDGRRAIFSTNNGMIHVCDMETGQERCCFKNLPANAVALAVSPDSQLLLGGLGNGEVVLWSLAEEKEVRRLVRHPFAVIGVAFLSDGKRCLTGSTANGVVHLWEVASGKEIKQWGISTTCPMTVSADGQLAATGHLDNTVVMWRLP